VAKVPRMKKFANESAGKWPSRLSRFHATVDSDERWLDGWLDGRWSISAVVRRTQIKSPLFVVPPAFELARDSLRDCPPLDTWPRLIARVTRTLPPRTCRFGFSIVACRPN